MYFAVSSDYLFCPVISFQVMRQPLEKSVKVGHEVTLRLSINTPSCFMVQKPVMNAFQMSVCTPERGRRNYTSYSGLHGMAPFETVAFCTHVGSQNWTVNRMCSNNAKVAITWWNFFCLNISVRYKKGVDLFCIVDLERFFILLKVATGFDPGVISLPRLGLFSGDPSGVSNSPFIDLL